MWLDNSSTKLAITIMFFAGLLAGCSQPEAFPVTGEVWYGPVCPVQQHPAQEDCQDRPYETKLFVKSGERAIHTFSSKADGTFVFTIAPGTYRIMGGQQIPWCESDLFTVESESIHVAVQCDSGIR